MNDETKCVVLRQYEDGSWDAFAHTWDLVADDEALLTIPEARRLMDRLHGAVADAHLLEAEVVA